MSRFDVGWEEVLSAPNTATSWPRWTPRKRAEGKRHTQAVIALARRRVNVLWALIRDRRLYELTPPPVKASP